MRILWVKANRILPVTSGGDIRSYHIARHLSRDHDLVFLSYYDGERDLSYEDQLRSHFPSSVAIATGKSPSRSLARTLDYIGRLPSRLPYAVGRFSSSAVQSAVQNSFDQRRFDVAVCDFLDAAVNFPAQLSVPSVLFEHNVESEIWRRHAATNSNPLKRRVYDLEFKKMARFECQSVMKFHHVIAVSERDRSLMEMWVEGSRITVVPTGVDFSQFPAESTARPGRNVVFVGAMDWEPNVDAMEYFCAEIWPLVLGQVPEAKLRIVGRNPLERARRLASESVEVTGKVPDVGEHLREAAVVVVPLRIGGGTRLKIYEAMAAGRAVVSTAVGAEGLDVHHGRDIVLANSPRSFADAVLTLLRDGNLRRKYEVAARELARKYDWSGIAVKFAQVLERVATSSQAANSRPRSATEMQANVGGGAETACKH
ncbi:MAG: glycosyltransferase [Acidobacteria bacterium]|nr:glycosyltransferase [Acidobacteriota bacterium]